MFPASRSVSIDAFISGLRARRSIFGIAADLSVGQSARTLRVIAAHLLSIWSQFIVRILSGHGSVRTIHLPAMHKRQDAAVGSAKSLDLDFSVPRRSGEFPAKWIAPHAERTWGDALRRLPF